MNTTQIIRRINQKKNIFFRLLNAMDAQIVIAMKLYEKNGLELKITCCACPEQYEVFKDGKQVAYYRLRHGKFRVDYPYCRGETIYEAEPDGDGSFYDNERLFYLSKAMRQVLLKLNNLSNT